MPLPFPSHFVCRWNRHWIDPALFPLFEEQDRPGFTPGKVSIFWKWAWRSGLSSFLRPLRIKTFFFFYRWLLKLKKPLFLHYWSEEFWLFWIVRAPDSSFETLSWDLFDWGDHALCRSDSLFLLRRFPRVSRWMMAKAKKKLYKFMSRLSSESE